MCSSAYAMIMHSLENLAETVLRIFFFFFLESLKYQIVYLNWNMSVSQNP